MTFCCFYGCRNSTGQFSYLQPWNVTKYFYSSNSYVYHSTNFSHLLLCRFAYFTFYLSVIRLKNADFRLSEHHFYSWTDPTVNKMTEMCEKWPQTQNYSIYNNINERKSANAQIWQVGTTEYLTFAVIFWSVWALQTPQLTKSTTSCRWVIFSSSCWVSFSSDESELSVVDVWLEAGASAGWSSRKRSSTISSVSPRLHPVSNGVRREVRRWHRDPF